MRVCGVRPRQPPPWLISEWQRVMASCDSSASLCVVLHGGEARTDCVVRWLGFMAYTSVYAYSLFRAALPSAVKCKLEVGVCSSERAEGTEGSSREAADDARQAGCSVCTISVNDSATLYQLVATVRLRSLPSVPRCRHPVLECVKHNKTVKDGHGGTVARCYEVRQL